MARAGSATNQLACQANEDGLKAAAADLFLLLRPLAVAVFVPFSNI